MGKQLDLFGYEPVELTEDQKKYSRKVQTPIYTPRGGASKSLCLLR